MVSEKTTALYRADVQAKGHAFTKEERENLLRPYLPAPPEESPDREVRRDQKVEKSKRRGRRKRVRPFIKSQLHILLYYLIHLIFGIYIRLRQIYHAIIDRVLAILYYHHRTPELIRKDVKNLSCLPKHLSVILKLRIEEDGSLEALMDEVAELCAWCASAGIPMLSVYEKTGALKSYMPAVHALAKQKLSSYFGPAPATPHLRVFAPNLPSNTSSPNPSPVIEPQTTEHQHPNGTNGHSLQTHQADLNLLLLSSSDGRDTLVDLTRTLTEMSQTDKLRASDITSDLINTEICATTSIPGRKRAHESQEQTALDSGEPELLVIFGPNVKLDGYPPWQVRLTEIFCVGDSGGDVSGRSSATVEYQAFLRGLWKYAGADMRFGR